MNNLSEIQQFMHSPAFNMLSQESQEDMRQQEKKYLLLYIKSLANEHFKNIAKEHGEPIRIKMSLDILGNVDIQFDESVAETSKQAESLTSGDAILTHPLDWSPFNQGFTIDTKFHENIFNALGFVIPKGQSAKVIVELNGEDYPAKFANVDVKGRKGNVLQLLYSGKTGLGSKLQTLFPDTYSFIKEQKEKLGGKKMVKLPENLKATIKIYSKEDRKNFMMECK